MEELLYMQVAEDLTAKIQTGILAIDEKLSERRLAAQYNVSRTVVREAVKVLNEKGLVHTVYGKGTYVNLPDDKMLIGKFRDALDVSQVNQDEVLEARELLESSMISFMFERVNDQDIEVLEELYQKMKECIEDGEAFVRMDEKFHLACSICTHNRVLSVMTGTLNQLANRQEILMDGSMREKANEEHGMIIMALKQKDEELLHKAMKSHINCIRSYAEYAGLRNMREAK